MEKKILTKEYVEKHGIEYDLLYGEYCSDRLLDADEEDGGKPFTGLVYDKYPNNMLSYYCNYNEGFEDGECVEFYKDGKIKCMKIMKRGQVKGESKEWFQSGKLKRVTDSSNGVRLSYIEWDEEGNVVKEKKQPSKTEVELLEKLKENIYD